METKNIAITALVVLLLAVSIFAITSNANKVDKEVVDELKVDYDASIDAVEGELSGAQEDVSELEAELATITAELAAAPTLEEVNALIAELDELKATATEAEQEIIGKYLDELVLGNGINVALDDSDLTQLSDTEINFNDNDKDVSEYFIFSADAKIVGSEESKYKEFEDNPYLVFENKGALKYEYRFDDAILLSDIGDGEDEDYLEIDFLGESITIVEADENGITVEKAIESYLEAGDVVDVDGITVTFLRAGTDSAIFDVDGETVIIENGETKKIGDLKLEVTGLFNEDGIEFDAVFIKAGESITETIEDGDYFSDDEMFVYYFNISGTELNMIGLALDEKMYDLDKDYKPLALGESFVFANDYISVLFEKTNEPTYIEYEVNKENTGSSCKYEIESNDEEGFWFETKEYDVVYLNKGKFYSDDECKTYINTYMELGNTGFRLKYESSDLKYEDLNIILYRFGVVGIDPSPSYIEDFMDETVFYNRDETVLDNYGVIFEGTEDWNEDFDNGLVFKVPEEMLEATIVVN